MPEAVKLPDNWLRPLGQTGLEVSAVCLGGGPLGSMPELFGEVTEADAVELVRAVFDSPIRFIDTSNGYSSGESERRIGRAVAAAGGLPDGVLIETKVDAEDGDYSGERVRRSVEDGYRPASEETLGAVQAMAALAEQHGTTLTQLALGWSLRDQRIASTIVGVTKVARVAETVAAASLELPDSLWDELETLTPAAENWLDHEAPG